MQLNDLELGYLVAALSTKGKNGNPLSKKYGVNNIDQKSIDKAKRQCEMFFLSAKKCILRSELDLSMIGYDFWLTRTRNGTGFLDESYKFGDDLTEIAHTFGSVSIKEKGGKLYFK